MPVDGRKIISIDVYKSEPYLSSGINILTVQNIKLSLKPNIHRGVVEYTTVPCHNLLHPRQLFFDLC